MRIRWIFYFFAQLLFSLPPPVPSAGVVERELQKEYEAKPFEEGREAPAIQIDIPKERLEIPDGGCVEVLRIQIEGAEAVAPKIVAGWVAEFEDRKLCLKEIYALCGKIDAEYAKRGYFLARAYPPPQTVRDGVLLIRVIEGRLGDITIEGAKHYSEPFIRSYFTRLRGRALRYDSFLRAMLLLNENSDLAAAAVFAKGREVGTADVIIKVEDGRPLHLYLNGNNYGRDITTNVRIGGRLDAGNLIAYGDTLSIAEVVGFPLNALYFTDLIYRIPVSRNGDFFELAYLFSKFKVEELYSLRLKGVSNIGTLKAVHALTRSRAIRIDLFGYFDIKQIQNYALGTLSSFDKLRVATFGCLMDRFGNRSGRDYLNVRAAVGIPDFLGGMNPVSRQCSRPGAGGLFVKFNADYDHLHILAPDWILSLHGSAQGSFYKLAIPEQIYIGGSDTVRGFPLAVSLGDSGYYGNVELRVPPPLLANVRAPVAKKKWREILQFTAFLDSGGAFYYGGTDTFLWGTGVGLRFRGPWILNWSVDVGFPLNHSDLSNGTMYYIKVTGQPF